MNAMLKLLDQQQVDRDLQRIRDRNMIKEKNENLNMGSSNTRNLVRRDDEPPLLIFFTK